MTIHENISKSAIWDKWQIYSKLQKDQILDEFRRKHPDDHFDKRLLVKFLQEKHQEQVLPL